jgi:hypothetical protein
VSRPFVVFLGLAALVFAGFIVLAQMAARRDRQVIPSLHAHGPSRPNTDPPRPTREVQDGVTLTWSTLEVGDTTVFGIGIKNDSGSVFVLGHPFATAVWNGREYATLRAPQGPDGRTAPETIAPGSGLALRLVFPWTATTPLIRLLVHGVADGRRLDWESEFPGVTRTASG